MPGQKSASPGEAVLRRLYEEEQLSYAEIARRFEVTRTCVMRWLRAAGISARAHSDATKLGSAKRVLTDEHRATLAANAAIARKAITPEGLKRGGEKRRGFVPPNKGVPWSEEQRAKQMVTRRTPEYRAAQSERQRGEKSHLWRGGLSPDEERRMHGWEWRQRRRECYRRDNWTCQDCRVHCGPQGERRIQAHHIIGRRFGGGDELENLVTLCVSCHHKREHRYSGSFIA